MKSLYKLKSKAIKSGVLNLVLIPALLLLFVLLQFRSAAQELNTLADGTYYIKKPGTDSFLTVQPATNRSMIFKPLADIADRSAQRFIFEKDLSVGGRYKVVAENPLGNFNFWSEWGEFLWPDQTFTPADHASNVFKNSNNKYALRGGDPTTAGDFYGIRGWDQVLYRGAVHEINPASYPFELIPYSSTKVDQVITFAEPAAKNVGTSNFNPGATTSSALPITYTSSNPGVATIVGGNIHIVGPGSVLITATQPGDATYNPAVLSRYFTVNAPVKSLIAHYKFNNTLTDENGAYNCEPIGTPSYVTGKAGTAVYLNGTTDFIVLPEGIAKSLDSFTVATFVKADVVLNNDRIFDFGDNTSNWMFMTTNGGGNKLRYIIHKSTGSDESVETDIDPLLTGQWKHIALTFAGGTAKIYVDGELMVTTPATGAIATKPSDLGFTMQNMIGRSQWNDPKYTGAFDDFRIYNYALTAPEIAVLSSGVLPVLITNYTAGLLTNGTVALNWKSASEVNNSNYLIEHSTDGRIFNSIGSVSGKTLTSPFYKYIDKAPVAGVNFYRLNQVDKDGKTTQLGIRSVSVKPVNSYGLTIYSNPVTANAINFNLPSPDSESFNVSISDISGKVVYKNMLRKNGTGIYSIETNLVPGIYVLTANQLNARLIRL